MPMTWVKKIAVLIATVLGLLLVLVVYVALTFNPNDYKPTIIQLVKDNKQRTLALEGDIRLSFWPKIGADLGAVTLSERGSDQRFAAIQHAKVALAVLPLLKKQIVVDTIYLDGAQVHVIKQADGRFNFDDLLSQDESPSEQINFDVQGIQVSNAAIQFDDEKSGARYQVERLNLSTSAVALKKPFEVSTQFHLTANQPAMNADVSVQAKVMADPEAKHFSMQGLDAQLKGSVLDGQAVTLTAQGGIDVDAEKSALDVAGLKLVLEGTFNGAQRVLSLQAPTLKLTPANISSEQVTLALKQTDAQGALDVRLVLAALQGTQQSVKSQGLTADLSLKAGARTVQGHFASPISLQLAEQVIDVPALAGQFDIQDPALPQGALKGQFKLGAHANLKQEQANSTFELQLAETKLNGDVKVAGFGTPHIGFKLHADTLNLNALLGAPAKTESVASPSSTAAAAKQDKPADLSVLKTLFVDGQVNIGKILYTPYTLTGLNVGIKADGQRLALQGLDVKLDDSHIQGNVAISQFTQPLYSFDLNIDKLDLNRYLPASPANTPAATKKPADKTAQTNEQVIDLSALKALNAQGAIRIGWLKYGNTEAKNLNIGLKAQQGLASLDPLNADLYQGTLRGAVKVDARAVPAISIQQSLQNIAVGPLLVDTINNDMLSGNGHLTLQVNAQGRTVTALKKSLGGMVDLRMADGAVKGFDLAGTIREAKGKLNLFKGASNNAADNTKKTDFSELTASFTLKNGVAHNEDLAMKAPVFRLTKGESKGDIDIGNEQINYLARPTLVNSLKGQGGKDAEQLGSISIPIKVTGPFDAPKFGVDMAALGQALAKSAALDALGDKLGGDKAGAVKSLLGGENKADALKGLLNGKSGSTSTDAKPAGSGTDPAQAPAAPAEEAKPADQLKQKALKKLLNF